MTTKKSVKVAVGAGKYAVLTTDIEDQTVAVVMPHPPMDPELAQAVATELASVYKMVSKWTNEPSDSWSVGAAGEFVEIYVPPAPGDDSGTVIGLDEEDAVSIIQAIAAALVVVREHKRVEACCGGG